MKNRMVALLLTISLVVIFAIPASAKVIYGPGTAPTPSGPLYDSDGNTYYYNQPSYGGGNSTANAIASILGMIISGSQQQAQQNTQLEQQKMQLEQQKMQLEQQKRQLELEAARNAQVKRQMEIIQRNHEITKRYEGYAKEEANRIITLLQKKGLRNGFKTIQERYQKIGWKCESHKDKRSIVLSGKGNKNNPNMEIAVLFDIINNVVVVANYLPFESGNDGLVIYEQARSSSKIRK
ncbi:hypothetical protein SDC9_55295 [bioreactor metagenome]|uniref:Uncharacterized protein n=1 Tax=bioreactor metagenome TaxID=1076179 RepID=A0A644WYT7_9ZZZZ